MRTYELMFIVHPDNAGDAFTAVIDKYKGVLAQQGCELLKTEEWGERKLAYPIKKQGRGSYVLCYFRAQPGVIDEIERRLRIDDNVMRFIVVQREKGFEPPADSVDVTETATEEAAGAAETEKTADAATKE